MPVRKMSYSLDERAADFVARRARKLKRSASSVLSEIVMDAAQQEARDRVLAELGAGVEIPESELRRWRKALGVPGRR